MASRSQSDLPLLDALRFCTGRSHAPFYAPGHKRGHSMPQSLKDLLGERVFTADLPELPELDNLFAPEGAIQEAQDLAAEAFGSDRTWFLANGSTCGIEAAILATCDPGEKIILPRNVHRSVIAGLILSGAMPVFVQPVYDDDWDMAHGVTPQAIATALHAHPDAVAVIVVYPTYYGTGCDLQTIAQITRQHGIPLLVDEAHGAHFRFHPDLPMPALEAGADLTVQSIHKTLSALTQASMLHVKGDRIDQNRLSKALQLVQSTSPSYLLLASLDAARRQMALRGKDLLSGAIALAQQARRDLRGIPGLRILDADSAATGSALDMTRLTVDVTGLGLTGFEADEILHHHHGVTAELPNLKTLTFILSIGNTPEDIDCLVEGFRALGQRAEGSGPLFDLNGDPSPFNAESLDSSPPPSTIGWPVLSSAVLAVPPVSPRDAFFADTTPVAIAQSIGHISAELICPYPPGIPLVFPGEAITEEAIAYLQKVKAMGGIITGCADTTLETLQVCDRSEQKDTDNYN